MINLEQLIAEMDQRTAAMVQKIIELNQPDYIEKFVGLYLEVDNSTK